MRTGLMSLGSGGRLALRRSSLAGMTVRIGDSTVIRDANVFFNDNFFVDHQNRTPAHGGTVLDDQAWALVADISGQDADVAPNVNPVANVDFDWPGYERQLAAELDSAPKTGAPGLE